MYEVPMPFVTKHFHYTRLLGDPEVETTLALFKVLDAGTLVAVVRPPVTEMGEDPSTWRVDCATATPAIRAHLKAYLPTHKLEYFEAASFADWYDNGTYEEMPWP